MSARGRCRVARHRRAGRRGPAAGSRRRRTAPGARGSRSAARARRSPAPRRCRCRAADAVLLVVSAIDVVHAHRPRSTTRVDRPGRVAGVVRQRSRVGRRPRRRYDAAVAPAELRRQPCVLQQGQVAQRHGRAAAGAVAGRGRPATGASVASARACSVGSRSRGAWNGRRRSGRCDEHAEGHKPLRRSRSGLVKRTQVLGWKGLPPGRGHRRTVHRSSTTGALDVEGSGR